VKTYWRNYIGGQWCDGEDGRRLSVDDPATAMPVAEVALAGAGDVDAAVAAARECVEARALTRMRPAERCRAMLNVSRHLSHRAEEIGALLTLETGIERQAGIQQVESTARIFEYYAGLADKVEGRSIPLGDGYVDFTLREPHGVSAHIVPWNFPLEIAARGVAPALATGNAVVVKSPELAPLAVTCLADAYEAAGLPRGALNIVCGFGGEAGAALSGHAGIDQIVFTGSVPTGKLVLHAAAERVIPSVVELGGKSAGIVLPDANLDFVVSSVMNGSFFFAGQICSAQSRLLVHRSVYAETVGRLEAMLRSLSIGPGIDGHFLTPLISAAQLHKVEAWAESGIRAGAQAVAGGERVRGLRGHFMQPTLLVDVAPSMQIMQAEIFGPVLAICPFDTTEEAVAIANGTAFGLCAGIYSQDLNAVHLLASRLIAGQIFVNEWFAGGIETPFGGVGQSGFGREKGQEGLDNYVRTKNVAIKLG
jgi:aldehyde dehydrogenase (NAD+)